MHAINEMIYDGAKENLDIEKKGSSKINFTIHEIKIV